MREIKVVGQDPSLRNWGIAIGTLDLVTNELSIQTVRTIRPTLSKGKQVRQNNLDLDSGYQLYQGAMAAAKDAHAIFVEVPVGSQSARAMASYGVCVGVLGALRANGIPFFEMTPTEIKLAGAGIKTATKQEMIAWATKRHPNANWPTYKRNGIDLISESEAEHQADAVAAIHAGIASNSFQQLLTVWAAQAKADYANSTQAT